MNNRYQPPRIERLGTLRELTQNGSAANADVPGGNDGTAYPIGNGNGNGPAS